MVIKRILTLLFTGAALILLIRASLIFIDADIPIGSRGGILNTPLKALEALETQKPQKPQKPQEPQEPQGDPPAGEPQGDSLKRIAETEQRIARELELYIPPPYEHFLDTADTVVKIITDNGLTIGAYSLLEQDSRPGIEMAVNGSIENLLAALTALETAPRYLRIQRISAAPKARNYSASLLILPAAPDDTPENTASVILSEDSEDRMTSDARRTARAVFGVRPSPAPRNLPAAPAETVTEPLKPVPASWLSVIGRYAGNQDGYIYALKDDRNGRIIPMKVGESRGEWRLLSDDHSRLIVEAEGERHILRWGEGG